MVVVYESDSITSKTSYHRHILKEGFISTEIFFIRKVNLIFFSQFYFPGMIYKRFVSQVVFIKVCVLNICATWVGCWFYITHQNCVFQYSLI